MTGRSTSANAISARDFLPKTKQSPNQAAGQEGAGVASNQSFLSTPTTQARGKRRSAAVSAEQNVQPHKKTQVDTATVRDEALPPDKGQAKSVLSSDDGVDDDEEDEYENDEDEIDEDENDEDENAEDENDEDEIDEDEDDDDDDDDDDLLVRKSESDASSDIQANNADSPLTEHTAPFATADHRNQTVRTPATPSTSAAETGQSPPLQVDRQRAERMSRMRIQIQEAQMNILKDKLEHEDRFGVGFE